MRKFLTQYVLVPILAIIGVGFIIIQFLGDIQPVFSFFYKKKPNVYCVKFKSENDQLSKLSDKLNFESENNSPCSLDDDFKIHWSTSNLDYQSSITEYSSSIWAFYSKCINSQLINISLPDFIEKYYQTKIGEKKCKLILKTIENWKKDPQIDPNTFVKIDQAFNR